MFPTPFYTHWPERYQLWAKNKPALYEVTEILGLLSCNSTWVISTYIVPNIKRKRTTLSVLHSISLSQSHNIVRSKLGYWSPGIWVTISFHSFCLHQIMSKHYFYQEKNNWICTESRIFVYNTFRRESNKFRSIFCLYVLFKWHPQATQWI